MPDREHPLRSLTHSQTFPTLDDGGDELVAHKLRHADGKHCVDRGVDIRIIAEALGHESLESIKIYTQVSFERTRRIAELFALPGS
jgi:site-specific recombinase XerD